VCSGTLNLNTSLESEAQAVAIGGERDMLTPSKIGFKVGLEEVQTVHRTNGQWQFITY